MYPCNHCSHAEPFAQAPSHHSSPLHPEFQRSVMKMDHEVEKNNINQDAPSCTPTHPPIISHFTSTSPTAQNGFVLSGFTNNLVGKRRSAKDRRLWSPNISYSIRFLLVFFHRLREGGNRFRLISQSHTHSPLTLLPFVCTSLMFVCICALSAMHLVDGLLRHQLAVC